MVMHCAVATALTDSLILEALQTASDVAKDTRNANFIISIKSELC